MDKAGTRVSKIPSFEESEDWLEPIAMTIALCAFPLLLVVMVINAVFPFDTAKVPFIDLSLGSVVFAIFYTICVFFWMWCKNIQKKRYSEMVADAERKDEEEYESFVETAFGKKEDMRRI